MHSGAVPRRLFTRLWLAALLLAACSEAPAPREPEPGARLSARTAALASVLERLARLDGTRIGRHAAERLRELPDCERVEARSARGGLAELWSALDCVDPGAPIAATDARSSSDLELVLPLGEPGAGSATLRGRARVAPDGGVELTLSLPPDGLDGARALLLPGGDSPGPGVLSTSQHLLHARVRPEGGLDLAAFVPEGGQADRMFRLKSEIFAGAVLDGTWEVAIYLPQEGSPVPRAALALGFEHRAPAVAALERLLGELRETWPVRRSPFAVGGANGACLFDLNLLPELAPCYVATERALVVGWNAGSVRKALDGEGALAPSAGGGAVVELFRFAEADVRLAEAAGARVPEGLAWPWRRLVAEGGRAEGAIHLRIALEAGA